MALSVKVALLTSLGFIVGMSWLVSQVARPIVELPTPLVVRGPAGAGPAGAVFAAGSGTGRGAGRREALVAGRFERASVTEAAEQDEAPSAAALLVAAAPATASEPAEPQLPPLYIPDAPVVTLAAEPREDPPISIAAGSSVMMMASVPEAIVADVPAAGARLLAALRPERRAEPVVGREPAAPEPREYTVKSGDSLVRILRRELGRDDAEALQTLLAANPEIAQRRDLIRPGEVLRIPELGVARPKLPLAAGGPDARVVAQAGQDSRTFRWYTIRKRDSLAAIARRHLHDADRWREIAELNRLPDADKILPGMRIKLPLTETDA
jgi:nucleoid-associated protein YgaU